MAVHLITFVYANDLLRIMSLSHYNQAIVEYFCPSRCKYMVSFNTLADHFISI